MTEKEYRALEFDSYSSIKDFAEDRKFYYERWIAKEAKRKKISRALIFGSLVDCQLLSPEELEDRFLVSQAKNLPGETTHLYKFTDKLYDLTLECMDSNGVVTRKMDELMKDAYDKVKYDEAGNIIAFKKDSFETAVLKFQGSDLEVWYNERRSSFGKSVITLQEIEKAEKVIDDLRKNWVTRDIINKKPSDRYTIHNQLAIVFEYKGIRLKGLLDKVIIDHQEKTISAYDLKTAWEVEDWGIYNYTKEKYYLQAAMYSLAIEALRDEHYPGYQVSNFKFIVADSNCYYNPLIFEVEEEALMEAMAGFTCNGRHYKGLQELLIELQWHKENNEWRINYDDFHNRGIVPIKTFKI